MINKNVVNPPSDVELEERVPYDEAQVQFIPYRPDYIKPSYDIELLEDVQESSSSFAELNENLQDLLDDLDLKRDLQSTQTPPQKVDLTIWDNA